MTDLCQHLIAYKGSHESFRGGWLCRDCEKLIELPELYAEYCVVLMAVRTGKRD